MTIYQIILAILFLAAGVWTLWNKNQTKQLNKKTKTLDEMEQYILNGLTEEQVYKKRQLQHVNTELEDRQKDLKAIKETISEKLDEYKTIQKQTEESFSKLQAVNNQYEQAYRQAQAALQAETAELEKIKLTRRAANEALLKQKEIREQKDNYRLIPTESELNDINKLCRVRQQLNKPRILSMLIWQTYWQPLAKVKFPIILKDKTKMGIYKITNTQTGECYIGQSTDVYKRWCEHCKMGLGIDTPPGNKLYKAIQDYGLHNFTFELIVECSCEELNDKERYFIELYQADTYGYNSTIGVNKK